MIANNDNNEVMGILPQPLATNLFAIGYQTAADFCFRCNAARPRPSFSEALRWLSAARQEMHDQAIRESRNAFIDVADDDVEWIEWAATRLAEEGFEKFVTEGKR